MYNAVTFMTEQGMSTKEITEYLGCTEEELAEACGLDSVADLEE